MTDSTEQPTPNAPLSVEARARIIDPDAWAALDKHGVHHSLSVQQACELSLEKAERLATPSTPAHDPALLARVRTVLGPFAKAAENVLGLSDGIDVRLDASFDLQDAIGRSRGARCEPKIDSLSVGHLRAARALIADLDAGASLPQPKYSHEYLFCITEDALPSAALIVAHEMIAAGHRLLLDLALLVEAKPPVDPTPSS